MLKHKLLLILFLGIISAGSLQAQSGKVDIILRQPPTNQLGVADMWNLELNNTSGKDMNIFLTGTCTEEKDGLIIEGKSKVFTIKPGKTNYKYNNFSNAEVKYNNGKYKEIILRTGNAPEGNYTICVTAYDENGTEVGRENCITQPVQQMGSITLLTPGDGEEVDPEQQIIFSWTPVNPSQKDGYSIKIAEVKKGQTPEEAMIWPNYDKQCPPNCIWDTKFLFPKSEMKFEEGKKYAWQVSSGNVNSEIGLFSSRSGIHLDIEFDSLKCTNQSGVYSFSLTAFNQSNNSFAANLMTPTVISSPPGTITLTSTITNPMNIGSSQVITGTISFGTSVIVSTVELEVIFQKVGTSVNYPVNAVPTIVMNNCCVPPPPNMVGWWDFDELSGTVANDRAGFNNVGAHINSPTIVNGTVGNALSFTGNQHVEVPNHFDINFAPCDNFTIDAWVRPPNQNGTFTILDKREGNNTCVVGYAVYIWNNRIGFQVSNNPSSSINYNATSSNVQSGSWRHVAVTYTRSTSTLSLYENGVVVGTHSNVIVLNLNNSAPLIIGMRQPSFGGGSFGGIIDELEIFKRALTQTEILSIFSAGSSGKCKK